MLAVAGGKGGTGKTTTTLGLARALEDPVLAVDADWDLPDLHNLAGVERSWDTSGEQPEHHGARAAPDPTASRESGHGGYPDGASVTSRVVAGTEPSVRVLPAPTDPSAHDRRAVLERCRTADAPVLVDCPAGAGPAAVGPLRVADGVLLVATPCAPAIRDAAKTAAMADAVGTPVAGAVICHTSAVPPDLSSVLDTSEVVGVPSVESPILDDDRVRSAYDTLGETLDVSGGVIAGDSG